MSAFILVADSEDANALTLEELSSSHGNAHDGKIPRFRKHISYLGR